MSSSTSHLVPVHFKAEEVISHGNGTYTVMIPAIPLDTGKEKLLEELYPNLREAAERLLDKEALLAAIATPSQVKADPTSHQLNEVLKRVRADADRLETYYQEVRAKEIATTAASDYPKAKNK